MIKTCPVLNKDKEGHTCSPLELTFQSVFSRQTVRLQIARHMLQRELSDLLCNYVPLVLGQTTLMINYVI